MRTFVGGRRLGLVVAHTVAAAGPPMPAAPSGYVYVAHHAIGDSEHNTGNMDPPDNLVVDLPPCTPSPLAENCFTVAHTACEAHDGCLAFALVNPGANEDPATVQGYQLFRAGIGNAYANVDWYLYAKPKSCGSCPNGVAVPAISAAGSASGAPVQTHQCTSKYPVRPDFVRNKTRRNNY